MKMNTIYFDNAASTPIDPVVIKLTKKLMHENFGNPSSIHNYGRHAKVLIENSRKSIANILNVSPSNIIFTSGGTEANNHILWNCVLNLGINNFITSPLEHPSVISTLKNISNYFKIKVNYVDINSKGNIDLKHLDFILKNSPASVVSLMHANNEIGNLLPVKQVKKICKSHKAIFHSDTVQTTGKFEMDLNALGFDFATASAHKFYGPKGTGFIYASSNNQIKSLITGGSQERNIKAGTENIHGIAGMALALEIAAKNFDKNLNHISSLKNRMIKRIKQELPEIGFYGESENKGLYTILNLKLPPNEKSEMLQNNLDIDGIAVSAGNACSSGVSNYSHVISALVEKTKNPSLRISFGKQNRNEEVEKLINTLKKIYSS